MAKKRIEFNIIKNDPTDGHGGFGIGSLSLENITPILVDVEEEEVWIEPQAMHARSKTERGVKYLPTLEELPSEGTKKYWVIRVAVDRKPEGPFYSGVTACALYINKPARRGYKSMPEHVNHLDRAMKSQIIVNQMEDNSKKALGQFLKEFNEKYWELSSDELKTALMIE